ncbi:MAG: YitT family protein [Tyzzerella sp.]|nr:YitT family protein [Tyzzerella sp.]
MENLYTVVLSEKMERQYGKRWKSKMKEKTRTYLFITCGTAITAMAISLFFVPNKIVNGGSSGLSTVIYYTVGMKPSLTNALINAVLLILSLFCFGKIFVAKTLFSIGLLSILIEVFSYFPPVTDNVLLATIFGSALYGIGIGMVLSQKSTTGGTDILGRLIQHKFPQWKIGKILLAVDLFVIFLSFITFKTTDAVLYGIIALFISTTTIDWLMRSLNISKLAFIITDKGQEIAELLISTSSRGVTLIDVTGVYSNQPKKMMVCALKESELPAFQKKILEKDEQAFIIYSESQQIIGRGFYTYG